MAATKLAELLKQREQTLQLSPSWKRKGYIAVSNKIIHDKAISLPAKGLYCYLLSRCFQKTNCFPGNDMIEKDLGLSKPSIVKYKQELERNELITIKRRGHGRTNVYVLKY